jgi:hypothetical protein
MTILKRTSSIGQGGCMQCKDAKKKWKKQNIETHWELQCDDKYPIQQNLTLTLSSTLYGRMVVVIAGNVSFIFPLSALGLTHLLFSKKMNAAHTHTLDPCYVMRQGPLQGCNNPNPKCLWAASWSRGKKEGQSEKKKKQGSTLCIACNNKYMHI